MANDKKSDGTVTLLNRSKRHFDLGLGEDKQPRRHAPGTTMAYTAEEAAKMGAYKDLVDISKLPGQVDTGKLKADNAKLAADNAKLQAQLDAMQADKTEAPSEEAAAGEGRRRR